MTVPALVYLHGMNSSPASEKASSVVEYAEKYHPDIVCKVPEQSVWPTENAKGLLECAKNFLKNGSLYIIGSSLGGYFGTWLRESLLAKCPRAKIKLVLINPVVRPYRLYHRYLGQQQNLYTGQSYWLGMKHVEQIQALEVDKLTCPQDILLLLQTGDNILDYTKALEKYNECSIDIEQGGSHAFERFEQKLPLIFSFLEGRNESQKK